MRTGVVGSDMEDTPVVAVSATGQGNPDVEIALKAGWNLIGYPLLEEGEIETVPAAGKIDYIYSGSRVYPGTLTTMVPGKGYWVYTNEAVSSSPITSLSDSGNVRETAQENMI